ncbi:MAG TPA: hypothetical protein VLO07_09895, partial [Thermoanaerobaculia bacterium]|nr:hypothetical protein [Thermoanaerobaculia bacterium]
MGKKFAVRVDASGLTAPDFVVDESGSPGRLQERRISWSEVSGLRITREHQGEVYYELDVPASPPFGDVLIIPGVNLKDPQGFREAVEQFTGRRFEKTFEEIPTETETESVAKVDGPADAGGKATSA